jgi:hypothetical protein
MAAGGRRNLRGTSIVARNEMKNNLPPLATPSDEEPIAAGGW